MFPADEPLLEMFPEDEPLIEMSPLALRPRSQDSTADTQLAAMGYRAELPRNLSMMSILGLSVAPPSKKACLADSSSADHLQLWVRSRPRPVPSLAFCLSASIQT